MISDLRYEFSVNHACRQVYPYAVFLIVERLWICEVDRNTFVSVRSYNRSSVTFLPYHEGKFIDLLCLSKLKDYEFVIIKWGKLMLRFVLVIVALPQGLQVIKINVTFHSCRSSDLFLWEDSKGYQYLFIFYAA